MQQSSKPKGLAKIWREIKRVFGGVLKKRRSKNIREMPIVETKKECIIPVTQDLYTCLLGQEAIKKMIEAYSFESVLDIGCGEGCHSIIFKAQGKSVTSLDYSESPYFVSNDQKGDCIVGDFMVYDFGAKQYDAVWCSHVLEHQLNPNFFLKKIHSILRDDGILAITVPPLKHEIVSGHVSLWNMGLLLYHLVLAGFDCSDIIAKKYGYNISVILIKKPIDIMPKIVFNSGDIRTIRKYLPKKIKFTDTILDTSFGGDIENIGWV